MKKLILAALAAATVATPMLATAAEAAPQYRERTVVRHQGDRTIVTRREVYRGYGNHRGWRRGERFDRRYAQNYREIDYRQYRGRHLYAPPRGYRWVRSGNDAVLVAVTGGIIGAVLAGAFN